MTEEILDGIVSRVNKRTGLSPFAERPKKEDFYPNSAEKKRAEDGGPMLISVLHNTEPAVCLAHRLLTPLTGVCFELTVKEVREIQAENKTRWLQVWRDPLPPPWCDLPGADAHAGISGLGHPVGEDKKIQKALCSRLVDIARLAWAMSPTSPEPSKAPEQSRPS